MNYATLGESCQCSMAVLTDNKKFLALNNPDYKLVFTHTYRYPGPTYNIISKLESDRPEDIKTKNNTNPLPAEEFKPKGCCGRN